MVVKKKQDKKPKKTQKKIPKKTQKKKVIKKVVKKKKTVPKTIDKATELANLKSLASLRNQQFPTSVSGVQQASINSKLQADLTKFLQDNKGQAKENKTGSKLLFQNIMSVVNGELKKVDTSKLTEEVKDKALEQLDKGGLTGFRMLDKILNSTFTSLILNTIGEYPALATALVMGTGAGAGQLKDKIVERVMKNVLTRTIQKIIKKIPTMSSTADADKEEDTEDKKKKPPPPPPADDLMNVGLGQEVPNAPTTESIDATRERFLREKNKMKKPTAPPLEPATGTPIPVGEPLPDLNYEEAMNFQPAPPTNPQATVRGNPIPVATAPPLPLVIQGSLAPIQFLNSLGLPTQVQGLGALTAVGVGELGRRFLNNRRGENDRLEQRQGLAQQGQGVVRGLGEQVAQQVAQRGQARMAEGVARGLQLGRQALDSSADLAERQAVNSRQIERAEGVEDRFEALGQRLRQSRSDLEIMRKRRELAMNDFRLRDREQGARQRVAENDLQSKMEEMDRIEKEARETLTQKENIEKRLERLRNPDPNLPLPRERDLDASARAFVPASREPSTTDIRASLEEMPVEMPSVPQFDIQDLFRSGTAEQGLY